MHVFILIVIIILRIIITIIILGKSVSYSTRNLDTIVEADSHSPLPEPGSVILPTQIPNNGYNEFP